MTKTKVMFKRLEDIIKEGFSEIRTDYKSFYGEFNSLRDEFNTFKNVCYGHFDALYNKLDVLKRDEYYSLINGLKRVEDEHKIIDHATILKEINSLKTSNN